MERVFEIIEDQLHLTGVEVSYEELEKKVKTVGDAIEFLREQGADI